MHSPKTVCLTRRQQRFRMEDLHCSLAKASFFMAHSISRIFLLKMHQHFQLSTPHCSVHLFESFLFSRFQRIDKPLQR